MDNRRFQVSGVRCQKIEIRGQRTDDREIEKEGERVRR